MWQFYSHISYQSDSPVVLLYIRKSLVYFFFLISTTFYFNRFKSWLLFFLEFVLNWTNLAENTTSLMSFISLHYYHCNPSTNFKWFNLVVNMISIYPLKLLFKYFCMECNWAACNVIFMLFLQILLFGICLCIVSFVITTSVSFVITTSVSFVINNKSFKAMGWKMVKQ